MNSLANLPEVIGFFSYSREDDESFTGRLSTLREAIQHELGAQLGLSRKNFRVWQDREAIAPGRQWEVAIKAAVEQSVFFIPIITPRAINSDYCHTEFDAFLARERALGRDNLVFPILYISVPELEQETQWRNHPVLSVIGRRQWVDWRPYRHLDIRAPVVSEAIERFCSNIVGALRQSRPSAEVRTPEAEDERRQHENEAKRRAEDQPLQRETDAKLQAETERRQQQAEAKRRAEDGMRQKSSVTGVHHIVNEHAKPDDEEEAYRNIANTYGRTELQTFLDRYPTGKRADQIRERLRVLKVQERSGPFLPIMLGLLISLAVVSAIFFVTRAMYH